MTVYIDPPIWPGHGRLWSHLISDASFAELHEFAGRLGLPSRAFEGDHYDVLDSRHQQAVAAGAVPISSRQVVALLQTSGLRRQKRRGERVLASWALRRGARLDAVQSPLPVPPGLLVAESVVVPTDGGLFVMQAPQEQVALHRRDDLPAVPVRPIGYLRTIAADSTGEPWQITAVLMAVAGTTLPTGVAGAVLAVEEVRRRAGDTPWWPVVAEALNAAADVRG